jgi:acetolactate decarboxylase
VHIIDHRLVGALHVDLVDHDGAGDEADGDAVFQTSSIEALLDGAYEGDLTIGELLEHGDLGVGTVDQLDGELIVIDGEAFVAAADGALRRPEPAESTPFAVVCHFDAAAAPHPIGPCAGFAAVTEAIDAVGPPVTVVVAIRLDGRFEELRLRSVARQHPPYPPLRVVTEHQSEWTLHDLDGSLVGFRFPDATSGLEVAGWHFHFIADDRCRGGHVIDVRLASGTVRLESTADLHVELPDSVAVPRPGPRDRSAEIRRVEGRDAD